MTQIRYGVIVKYDQLITGLKEMIKFDESLNEWVTRIENLDKDDDDYRHDLFELFDEKDTTLDFVIMPHGACCDLIEDEFFVGSQKYYGGLGRGDTSCKVILPDRPIMEEIENWCEYMNFPTPQLYLLATGCAFCT